jgi:hypothetical protein
MFGAAVAVFSSSPVQGQGPLCDGAHSGFCIDNTNTYQTNLCATSDYTVEGDKNGACNGTSVPTFFLFLFNGIGRLLRSKFRRDGYVLE